MPFSSGAGSNICLILNHVFSTRRFLVGLVELFVSLKLEGQLVEDGVNLFGNKIVHLLD